MMGRFSRPLMVALFIVQPCLFLGSVVLPNGMLPFACALLAGVLCGLVHCFFGSRMVHLGWQSAIFCMAAATVIASILVILFLLFEFSSQPHVFKAMLVMALQLGFSIAVVDVYRTLGADGLREESEGILADRGTGKFFARLLLAFALVSLACRSCDTYVLTGYTQSIGTGIATFAGHIVASFVIVSLCDRDKSVTLLYRVALPCIGIGFVFLLFEARGLVGGVVSSLLVSIGFELVNIVVWPLVLRVACRSSHPVVRVGWYVVVTYAVVAVGRMLTGAIDAATVSSSVVGLVCIVLLVLLAFVVLPEDRIRAFLGESASKGDGPGEAGAERVLREKVLLFAKRWGLTNRETEVLELLVRGRTLKVVADKLSISKGTAGTHIASVYRKVGVHSQQELIDLFESESGSLLGDA